MAIPAVSNSIDPSITPSALVQGHPSSLPISEITIGGRSYTVTVESSEPLVSSPASDTLEKIEYLVKIHLQHLQLEGIDLNNVVIEQLDEEGLIYKTKREENWEQKTLLSSTINNFNPFNPFNEAYPLPSSLKEITPLTIGNIFKSIIDPLIVKPREQTPPSVSPKPTSRPRFIFTPTSAEDISINPPKNGTSTSKVAGRRTNESSPTAPKQMESPAADITTEEQNLDEKSNSVWSWTTKKLRNLVSFVPNLVFRSNSYEIRNPSPEMEERVKGFLQENPTIKDQFTDIGKFA